MSDAIFLGHDAAHAAGSDGYHIDLPPVAAAKTPVPQCKLVNDPSLCQPPKPSYWRLFFPEVRGCDFLSCKASSSAAAVVPAPSAPVPSAGSHLIALNKT